MSHEITLAIAGAAALQWLVFIAMSAFAKKRGALDGKLIASTLLFVVAWGIAFDARALLSKPEVKAAEASAAGGKKSAGSCAAIEAGMTADRVRTMMGEPHEIKPNEETRGPGAAVWTYSDVRCAVHVVDGNVEFVE